MEFKKENKKCVLIDNRLYLKLGEGKYQRVFLESNTCAVFGEIEEQSLSPVDVVEYLIDRSKVAISQLKVGTKFMAKNRIYMLLEIVYDRVGDIYKCYDYAKEKVVNFPSEALVDPF